ncbi:flagellar hook-length control protein FliK [Luminiphilus sp.]|nr:flagellar hook-length control protein FliK [Luminiphilus sp.]
MSATTEFVILQAAAAPSSAKSASELGLPSDQSAGGEFADTLKAELTSSQSNDKTGKSLPQGGEKPPSAPSEIDSAEPAPSPRTSEPMTSDTSGVEKKASLAQVEPGTTDPSYPSPDDVSDAHHAGDLSQTQADSDGHSVSQTVTTVSLAAHSVQRTVMAASVSEALGVKDQRITARLEALQHLVGSAKPDAIAGEIDPELLQSLAHSDMPLADVGHQLRQMANAGIRHFDIATFNQGLTAGLSNRPTSSQPSIPLPTAERGQGVTFGVTQPGQYQSGANGFETLASDSARENAVIDRAQRLEAIQRMVSQTGNSEVLGTLSAELQHELANSDEPLNSVQARLQSLSNSGVTELDKAQYAALKADSALASPVQTSRLVGSQASAAVEGNPAATTVTAAMVGQENTLRSASAGTVDAGLASVEDLTSDSRRTAASVPGQITTSVNLHGKQSASGVSSGASQNVEGQDSLDGTDLSARQNTTPRQIAGEQSILNPGKASSAVPMTAQMTAQLRSAIAQARNPDQGAAMSALDQTRNESQPGQPSLLGALGPASEAGDAETSTQLSAHRARMAMSVNGQQPTNAKAAASDPSISLRAMTQEQPTEGRMTSEMQSARSLSFELPSQSMNASTATLQASPPAAVTAAPNAVTAAPLSRAGSEHVMQTQPGTPQFSQELGGQVRVFVNNGLQEARLQLTPADLGKVQITINMEGEHARVVFVAETAVARDLLDQSMPRLREMLQQSGIQLAQGDVSDQAESQRREGSAGGDAESLAQSGSETAPGSEEQRLNPARGELNDSGRVDTYI